MFTLFELAVALALLAAGPIVTAAPATTNVTAQEFQTHRVDTALEVKRLDGDVAAQRQATDSLRIAVEGYQKIAFEQMAFIRTIVQWGLALLALILTVTGWFIKDLLGRATKIDRSLKEYQDYIHNNIGEIRRRAEEDTVKDTLNMLDSTSPYDRRQAATRLGLYVDRLLPYYDSLLAKVHAKEDRQTRHLVINLLKSISPTRFGSDFPKILNEEQDPQIATIIVSCLADVEDDPLPRMLHLAANKRRQWLSSYISMWSYYHRAEGTLLVRLATEPVFQEQERFHAVSAVAHYLPDQELESIIRQLGSMHPAGGPENSIITKAIGTLEGVMKLRQQ